MTDSRSQEDIWKADSEQLSEDLASKQTIIKKNEVPIKIASSSSKKKTAPSPASVKGSSKTDRHLRQQLGLDDA